MVVLALAFITAWPGSSGEGGRQAGAPGDRRPGGSPALRVDRESIDLGDARLGAFVEASFVLTNAGSQPLRLLQPPYIEVVEGC